MVRKTEANVDLSHSSSFYIISHFIYTKALAEKFPAGGGQWKNQDREIALISLPLRYSGGIWGALGIHPGLISRDRYIHSTA